MKALVLAILILGCSDPTGEDQCEWREQTIDVIYGTMGESVMRDRVATMSSEGWECPSTTLYNAFGQAFGVRYVCKICD